MKKFLTKITGFVLGAAMIVGVGAGLGVSNYKDANAAASTYTHTFASGDITTSAGNITLSKITWTQTAATYISFDSNKGVQIGSSKKPTSSFSLTTSAFTDAITSITVNTSIGSEGTAKLSISVGDNSVVSSQSLTTTATDYKYDKLNYTGAVAISYANTAKAFYIKSITINHGIDESFSVDLSGVGSNIAISNTSDTAKGEYKNTLTPDAGYTITSCSCTMGGTDQTITDGENGAKVIDIASATGNIVIAAQATLNVYSVTVTGEHIKQSGDSPITQVNHGDPFTATIVPESESYVIVPGSISATMGGSSTGVTVTGNSINITSVTGNIVITGSAVSATQHAFSANLTNTEWVSGNPGNFVDSAHEGNYVWKFAAKEGYENLSLSMTINGSVVTEGIEGDTITVVPNTITGPVVVNASASAKNYSITSDLTHVVTDNPATTAAHDSSYTATLSAESGYALTKDDILVYMGGNLIELTSTTISIDKVTGPIEILAEANETKEYVKYEDVISPGRYLVVGNYNSSDDAMNNTVTKSRLQLTNVTINDNTISTSDNAVVWDIQPYKGYWTIKDVQNHQYLASTSSDNQICLADSISDKACWTISGTTDHAIVNKSPVTSNKGFLRRNQNNGFACYTSSTGSAPVLYKLNEKTDIENLEDLIAEYTNGGVYTKKTTIGLNEESRTEHVDYFHCSLNEEKRTTYYNDNRLLLAAENGQVRSGEHADGSYYYSDGKIARQHATEDMTESIDWTKLSEDDYVQKSDATKLEDIYITLNTFSADNYFDTWGYSSVNSCYYYSLSADDLSPLVDDRRPCQVWNDFLAFCAPMFYNNTGNYLTPDSITIEEKVDTKETKYLAITLLLSDGDSGKLTGTYLAQARVYKGNTIFEESL